MLTLLRAVDASVYGKPCNILTLAPGGFVVPLAEGMLYRKLVSNWGAGLLPAAAAAAAILKPGAHAGVTLIVDRDEEMVM